MTPPALVNGEDPKEPAKNRRMMTVHIFCEATTPASKIEKPANETANRTCLPYSSDKGAQMSGPVAEKRSRSAYAFVVYVFSSSTWINGNFQQKFLGVSIPRANPNTNNDRPSVATSSPVPKSAINPVIPPENMDEHSETARVANAMEKTIIHL